MTVLVSKDNKVLTPTNEFLNYIYYNCENEDSLEMLSFSDPIIIRLAKEFTYEKAFKQDVIEIEMDNAFYPERRIIGEYEYILPIMVITINELKSGLSEERLKLSKKAEYLAVLPF